MKHHVFYGDDLVGIDLPADVEVVSAPPPLPPLHGADAAILNALANPIGAEPLEALLRPGMRLTVAFDDPCLPIPPMWDDVRKRAIDLVMGAARNKGVREDRVTFLCANGLHRKWTRRELAHLIGRRAYAENVLCHDAEDPGGIVHIGDTDEGYDVEVNRAIVDCDLAVYVNVNWTSMNGGWKSIVVGLGSLRSISHHHNAKVIGAGGSVVQPETSAMHRIIGEMGRLAATRVNVLQIETVLNNDLWGLGRRIVPALARRSSLLPQSVKSVLRRRMRSAYKLVSVNAGRPDLVHPHTLKALYRQQNVRVDEQADVVIMGVPNLSPYAAFSEINPVLFHNLLLGYLFNLYHDRPVLKKGGVLIAINPVLNRFHPRHHPSYIEFYERILPMRGSLSPGEIEARYAMEFARNPVYIDRYRRGYAYHGIHPFYAYGMGMHHMDYIGKIIVVGAKDGGVVDRLGCDSASDVGSALRVAERHLDGTGTRYLLDVPPLFVSEVARGEVP